MNDDTGGRKSAVQKIVDFLRRVLGDLLVPVLVTGLFSVVGLQNCSPEAQSKHASDVCQGRIANQLISSPDRSDILLQWALTRAMFSYNVSLPLRTDGQRGPETRAVEERLGEMFGLTPPNRTADSALFRDKLAGVLIEARDIAPFSQLEGCADVPIE